MDPVPRWNLWFNRLGKVKGVAIVFRASDYALEFKCPYLTEDDRVAYCKDLAEALNTLPRSGWLGQGLPPTVSAE